MKNVVVMEFYQDGCAPCQTMSTILDRLAEEFGDKILVQKLNVKDNLSEVQVYHVMGTPTTIIEVDGEVVFKGAGIYPISVLREQINQHV